MPVQACPRGQQHHRSLDCDAAPHGVEHRGGFGRQLSRRASKLSRACLKPLRPTRFFASSHGTTPLAPRPACVIAPRHFCAALPAVALGIPSAGSSGRSPLPAAGAVAAASSSLQLRMEQTQQTTCCTIIGVWATPDRPDLVEV